jgi:hypothetical protein
MRNLLHFGLCFFLLLIAPGFATGQEGSEQPSQGQSKSEIQGYFQDHPQELARDQIQSQEPAQDQPAPTQVSPSALVTVRGVVRNAASGEPLARVLVRVEGDAGTGALTDGEGRFGIPGVPAGPQTFRLLKPGFRDRPYATEEVDNQVDGPAHSVLVSAQMPDLVFTIAPNCTIRGRVELSTGDPAQGMVVVLLKQAIHNGRAVWMQDTNTATNGDGIYRFAGLPDGVYAVYTLPALESEPAVTAVAVGSGARVARSGYPAVFYPDAREFSGAAHIHLAAGEQAEANLLLTLEPFHTVTAFAMQQVAGSRTAPAADRLTATVLDATGRPTPYSAQYDDATHAIQASLPDGTYSLLVFGFRHPQFLNDVVILPKEGNRAGALVGSVDFVVAGHAVTGLRFPLGAPQSNTVHLRYLRSTSSQTAAPTTAQDNSVSLLVDQADGLPQQSNTDLSTLDAGQDTIELTLTRPGAYWVGAYVQQKGWCANSFTAGGINLAREPLVMGLSASAPAMELTLRDDCATLELTLPSALSTFVPGDEPFYTVYVVPDFDTPEDVPPMTVHPSSGRTLNLDGLTPGGYHVYTFNTPVRLEYRNPTVLAALPNGGQQVTVSPGVTSSLVLEVPEP